MLKDTRPAVRRVRKSFLEGSKENGALNEPEIGPKVALKATARTRPFVPSGLTALNVAEVILPMSVTKEFPLASEGL